MRIAALWLRGVCLACALALFLSACGIGDLLPQPTATKTVNTLLISITPTPLASVTPLTFVSCPTVREYVGKEAQGVVRSPNGAIAEGQLWVWIQSFGYTHSGQADYAGGKFVWRMTGQGDFHVVALGPHGEQLIPKEGPTAHQGSTWDTHPGDEWGTSMVFSSAGCWDLRVWRDDIMGDVALRIE
jgi:hypothetical protein